MPIFANSAKAASTKCTAASRVAAARMRSCSTATSSRRQATISGSAGPSIPGIIACVAWSADVQGSEYFTIFVREWDGCRDHPDRIEDTDGSAIWSKDCKSLFYVKLDDNHRPTQVWRHRLGTEQADDVLVYEENGRRLVHPSA